MARRRHDWPDLLALMHRLRSPGGCPWDAEQTHRSLRPYLLEEAYEAVEAVEAGCDEALCDELGDVLLQVVFHAELASERGAFDASEVVDRLCEKLVRRHPHVFADVEASSAADVVRNWERIKADERASGGTGRPSTTANSALDGIPRSLPALARAHRIGARARTTGLDWSDADGPLEKIREELDEIAAAAGAGHERVHEEVGDLLLAAASYARLLGVNAETALRDALERFETRYRRVEREFRRKGLDMREADPRTLEAAWRRAKLESP